MARELQARRSPRTTIQLVEEHELRRLAHPYKEEAVRVVATGNLTLQGRQTIDGVDCVPPNRILVAGQTLGQNNGIYECRDYVWFRTTDACHSDMLRYGTTVFVNEGTHAGQRWRLQTSNVVLDTTVQTWAPDDFATNTALATETANRIAGDALLIPLSQRGANNGVATLDGSGKLTTSQLPDLAISDFLGVVPSQAAMLALTGQRGDWTVRSDTSSTWMLKVDGGSSLSDWQLLSTPTDAVTSVNGRTGAVTGLAEVGTAVAMGIALG